MIQVVSTLQNSAVCTHTDTHKKHTDTNTRDAHRFGSHFPLMCYFGEHYLLPPLQFSGRDFGTRCKNGQCSRTKMLKFDGQFRKRRTINLLKLTETRLEFCIVAIIIQQATEQIDVNAITKEIPQLLQSPFVAQIARVADEHVITLLFNYFEEQTSFPNCLPI